MTTHDNRKNSIGIWGLIVLLLLFLTGCSPDSQSSAYQDVDFAMGTTISQNFISGGSEEQAQNVLSVIRELEQVISWRVEGSDVAKINEAAGTDQYVEVSKEAAEYLMACQDVYEKTQGRLDITVGVASRLWDIGGDDPRIPKEEELIQALQIIGGEKLTIGYRNDTSDAENLSSDSDQTDIPYVTYNQPGGQLDLGAVGKGLACDEIASYIEENGLSEEINGTFSVGGSVLIYGSKGSDASWNIGIRDPRGEEGSYMGSLTFSQREGDKICVSTSGDYEKYFEEDGKRYHHILDPATAAPADSDLISVTVISESGFLTDALSTACFVAGKEEALRLGDLFGAEIILIDKEHKISMTEGAQTYFTLLSKEYSLENEEK